MFPHPDIPNSYVFCCIIFKYKMWLFFPRASFHYRKHKAATFPRHITQGWRGIKAALERNPHILVQIFTQQAFISHATAFLFIARRSNAFLCAKYWSLGWTRLNFARRRNHKSISAGADHTHIQYFRCHSIWLITTWIIPFALGNKFATGRALLWGFVHGKEGRGRNKYLKKIPLDAMGDNGSFHVASGAQPSVRSIWNMAADTLFHLHRGWERENATV